MRTKSRVATLMRLANAALTTAGILQGDTINESYNGQTSGFSVTVSMSGLIPALVIYYQKASDTRTVDRRKILEAIGNMMHNDEEFHRKNQNTFTAINGAETLLRTAVGLEQKKQKILAAEVVECAVALKQMIRTYNLKKDEESE